MAIGVAALWFALYRSPTYPPDPGLMLASAGVFFLSALVLLYRIHAHEWPRLAQLGFAISAAGLGLWIVGSTTRALQVGWGLFCVGLVPIGVTAITNRLPLSTRLLLPIGGLLLLGEPLKYLFGERIGGLTIFSTFGLGWLIVGVLLVLESSDRSPRPKPS